MNDNHSPAKPFSDPYVMGFFLGLVLLASFLILGAGLGASSGMARFGAYLEGLVLPAHTAAGEYFGKWGKTPLNYYLVYMAAGIILGGFFSALTHRRASFVVERGKRAPAFLRLFYAGIGGILVGFASRLAGGCTSGQALTGGALLLTGSFVFLICLFAAGYASAFIFRRQWHD